MGLGPGKILAAPPFASLPLEAAGKSREGGRETPLQFEKIVVFDYPIIPSYKVETTMDFP